MHKKQNTTKFESQLHQNTPIVSQRIRYDRIYIFEWTTPLKQEARALMMTQIKQNEHY